MNNLEQILQMGQEVHARVTQLQSELGQKTVSCSSGGGMVTATAVVDGSGRIRGIKIDPSLLAAGDVEMLEDLVVAAVGEAQARANQVREDEMRKLTGGLPFPFPGL